MFPANAYVIRDATPTDERALRRLAALDRRAPLEGRVLIGEIEGAAAAAVSLADGRVVADPGKHTARLLPLLGMRSRSRRRYAETPSLPDRLRHAMHGWAARATT